MPASTPTDQLRSLTGPVASIRTPFTADGEVDTSGLRRYLDLCLETDAQALLLTYGDSLFSLLDDSEVAMLTQLVTQHVAGRRPVCAATGRWNTRQSVEFARDCRRWGAVLLMVLPPDWGASCTADSLVQHFAEVGAEIPLMAVSNVFTERQISFAIEVTTRLLAEVPQIVAVKDDLAGDYGRRLALLASERWAVISGGQKKNHLGVVPFGSDAYLSTFVTFHPRVTGMYWDAIAAGDLKTARGVVERYDMPLFDLLLKTTGGFDAALHGIYELYGIYGRWRRRPYHSLSDEQLARLKAGLDALQLP